MSLKPSELADLVVAELPDIVTAVNYGTGGGKASLLASSLTRRYISPRDIWSNWFANSKQNNPAETAIARRPPGKTRRAKLPHRDPQSSSPLEL